MIKNISLYLVTLGLIILLATACERREKQQGAASVSYSNVATEVEPKVSGGSGLTQVADVAPKVGKGGVDGAEVYARACAACHQGNGQGVPGVFPPLDGSPYVTGPNVERLAAIMVYGLMGPIKVLGTEYNGVMTPQGAILKDDELAAVASYVRSAWSNKASPIEASVFTKVREKYGQRASFNIQELGAE